MSRPKIPFVFTFNNDWVTPAAVCFLSILESHPADLDLELIVIHTGITESNQELLSRQVSGSSNASLRFIEITGDEFGTVPHLEERSGQRYAVDTYTRLLLPDLLPEYGKVFFSDVDIVFLGSVAEIFFEDLGSDLLAAVKNPYMSYTIAREGRSGFGDEFVNRYFNAGVLVMNLEQMRRDDSVGLFRDGMKTRYRLQDQDILNTVCRDRVRFLPSRYNFLVYLLEKDLSEVFEVIDHEDELLEAIHDPVVIHYAGSAKPWNDGSVVAAEEWIYFYSRSVVCDRERLGKLVADLKKKRKNRLRYNLFWTMNVLTLGRVGRFRKGASRYRLLTRRRARYNPSVAVEG